MAIARVRAEIACLKFELKMRAYDDYLTEQKYRADQPRAPKGTSEDGRWVVDPSSARQLELVAGIAERLEGLGGICVFSGGPVRDLFVDIRRLIAEMR